MVQQLIPIEKIGAKRTGPHKGGIRQKYVLSDQQRRILLERYDGRTETLDELMRYFPGVPRFKVRHWAGEMGLARQKEPFWTEQDEEYLRQYLHKKSLKDIAKHLGRTVVAVKLKAKRLGVNKTQEGYTMHGLCMGLGCDHHTVERWIKKGWLKGRRRQSERENDIWLFTDAQVRAFVKEHPQEIDQRRVEWLWFIDVLLSNTHGLGELELPETEAE